VTNKLLKISFCLNEILNEPLVAKIKWKNEKMRKWENEMVSEMVKWERVVDDWLIG